MIASGVIALWFGSIGSIPTGWTLCDGTAGTPDLRNNVPVGAGDTYGVGDTGGSINHTHTVTTVGHLHELPGGASFEIGNDFSDESTTTAPAGNAQSSNNLPPYHALAFIMKT
ncbi:hypothetical protein LCGC14_1113860 [marine sediment metagenome]|uniref:Phage tail collar domain-containing protein n=1 Tax=marine sediment metagenome TaxID=412755 RepID=A0A0F9QC06_9ZZZZ